MISAEVKEMVEAVCFKSWRDDHVPPFNLFRPHITHPSASVVSASQCLPADSYTRPVEWTLTLEKSHLG